MLCSDVIVEYVKTYLYEEIELHVHLLRSHASTPAEINERLPYGELPVKGELLRHVTHPRPRNTRSSGSWPAAQHPDLPGI